jgi:hypothetical protein
MPEPTDKNEARAEADAAIVAAVETNQRTETLYRALLAMHEERHRLAREVAILRVRVDRAYDLIAGRGRRRARHDDAYRIVRNRIMENAAALAGDSDPLYEALDRSDVEDLCEAEPDLAEDIRHVAFEIDPLLAVPEPRKKDDEEKAQPPDRGEPPLKTSLRSAIRDVAGAGLSSEQVDEILEIAWGKAKDESRERKEHREPSEETD